jgi:hypothetical protein
MMEGAYFFPSTPWITHGMALKPVWVVEQFSCSISPKGMSDVLWFFGWICEQVKLPSTDPHKVTVQLPSTDPHKARDECKMKLLSTQNCLGKNLEDEVKTNKIV